MANCPKCGKEARSLGQQHVEDEGNVEVFQCSVGCQQKVPYPGGPGGEDSDWPVEFYVDANSGEVVLLRPSAEWFN